MTRLSFENLSSLYRATRFNGSGRDGDLNIQSEAMQEILKVALTDKRQYGISLIDEEQVHSIATGSLVRIHIDDPRVGLGLFADSFVDVLKFPPARIKEPKFYLRSDQWASFDASPPEIVLRYRSSLCLISILSQCAAYLDKDNQELVFIENGRFSIPIIYESEDLEFIDQSSVDRLAERFGDCTHEDQKRAILSKTLHYNLSSTSPNDRFKALLRYLPEVIKNFDEGYRLFIANFSYDKIKDEVESAKLEELSKIHKTFSDIQNQILSIPVATVIVATQLKKTESYNLEFWVNTGVLIGVWIFAILTVLVIRNQSHTLTAIGDELARKKKKIESDYAAIRGVVDQSFASVELRLKRQRWAFRFVILIIVVGFLMAHVLYLALTDTAWGFVMQLCGSVSNILGAQELSPQIPQLADDQSVMIGPREVSPVPLDMDTTEVKPQPPPDPP